MNIMKVFNILLNLTCHNEYNCNCISGQIELYHSEDHTQNVHHKTRHRQNFPASAISAVIEVDAGKRHQEELPPRVNQNLWYSIPHLCELLLQMYSVGLCMFDVGFKH